MLRKKHTRRYDIQKAITPPKPPSINPAPASREKPLVRPSTGLGVSMFSREGMVVVVAGLSQDVIW